MATDSNKSQATLFTPEVVNLLEKREAEMECGEGIAIPNVSDFIETLGKRRNPNN